MDEGIYQCMAENVAGKVYCTANVKVSGTTVLLALNYLYKSASLYAIVKSVEQGTPTRFK